MHLKSLMYFWTFLAKRQVYTKCNVGRKIKLKINWDTKRQVKFMSFFFLTDTTKLTSMFNVPCGRETSKYIHVTPINWVRKHPKSKTEWAQTSNHTVRWAKHFPIHFPLNSMLSRCKEWIFGASFTVSFRRLLASVFDELNLILGFFILVLNAVCYNCLTILNITDCVMHA